jgi:hypothetical protein
VVRRNLLPEVAVGLLIAPVAYFQWLRGVVGGLSISYQGRGVKRRPLIEGCPEISHTHPLKKIWATALFCTTLDGTHCSVFTWSKLTHTPLFDWHAHARF